MVAAARGAEVPRRVSVVGTVEGRMQSRLASEVAGIVITMEVAIGQQVAKDEPLLQLNTDQLEHQRAQVAATLEAVQSEHQELRNGFRPEHRRAAKAAMERAQAYSQQWGKQWKRTEQLFETGAINPGDRDDTFAQMMAAQQEYERTKALYELSERGPRAERISAAAARVQSQQSQLRLLDDQIQKATLRAPYGGVISARHVELGEWVPRGGPVVDLIDLNNVDVVCQLPERYIAGISVASMAMVHIDAFAAQTFEGQIRIISPQADLTSRTFAVKVALENAGQQIRSGMFARIDLPVGPSQSALLVPKDAVVSQGGRDMVFVVTGDVAQAKAVTVLGYWGSDAQVSGPLSDSDLVVIGGNERLMLAGPPGTPRQVRIVQP